VVSVSAEEIAKVLAAEEVEAAETLARAKRAASATAEEKVLLEKIRTELFPGDGYPWKSTKKSRTCAKYAAKYEKLWGKSVLVNKSCTAWVEEGAKIGVGDILTYGMADLEASERVSALELIRRLVPLVRVKGREKEMTQAIHADVLAVLCVGGLALALRRSPNDVVDLMVTLLPGMGDQERLLLLKTLIALPKKEISASHVLGFLRNWKTMAPALPSGEEMRGLLGFWAVVNLVEPERVDSLVASAAGAVKSLPEATRVRGLVAFGRGFREKGEAQKKAAQRAASEYEERVAKIEADRRTREAKRRELREPALVALGAGFFGAVLIGVLLAVLAVERNTRLFMGALSRAAGARNEGDKNR
jgi:hypothetical protein